MDRCTVNMAHAQVGFLDVFVQPSWEAMKLMLPKVEINISNTKINKEKWKELIHLYDNKMQEPKLETSNNSLLELPSESSPDQKNQAEPIESNVALPLSKSDSMVIDLELNNKDKN